MYVCQKQRSVVIQRSILCRSHNNYMRLNMGKYAIVLLFLSRHSPSHARGVGDDMSAHLRNNLRELWAFHWNFVINFLSFSFKIPFFSSCSTIISDNDDNDNDDVDDVQRNFHVKNSRSSVERMNFIIYFDCEQKKKILPYFGATTNENHKTFFSFLSPFSISE